MNINERNIEREGKKLNYTSSVNAVYNKNVSFMKN